MLYLSNALLSVVTVSWFVYTVSVLSPDWLCFVLPDFCMHMINVHSYVCIRVCSVVGCKVVLCWMNGYHKLLGVFFFFFRYRCVYHILRPFLSCAVHTYSFRLDTCLQLHSSCTYMLLIPTDRNG